MSCLPCFLSSAISSVMFSFLIHVFFHYLTSLAYLLAFCLPPPDSCSALPSMLKILIHTFYMIKNLNLVFLNLCSRFSTPHHLVIPSCYLTLDMYCNILWSQLASSPSRLSVSAQVSAAYFNAGLTDHSKHSHFPLVECYGLLASIPILSIYSKHRISYPIM